MLDALEVALSGLGMTGLVLGSFLALIVGMAFAVDRVRMWSAKRRDSRARLLLLRSRATP